MMKRILAMFMCLTLIFSSSNVAFAAESLEVIEEQQGDGNQIETATITLRFKKWYRRQQKRF